MKALTKTDFHFEGQKNVYHGKVRDVYDINDDVIVMVATDRISDGWDGLLTKATFYPPYGSPVEVLTGHEITVPSEMYRNAGSGKMVISGYAIENNTLVKRKYTLPCVMEVQNTIVRRGANAIPGTESVYEQLRKQMELCGNLYARLPYHQAQRRYNS